MIAEHRDCTVKQVEIEHAFLRLENVPGEFAKADNIEAGLRHAQRIALPIAFIDMFGIVRSADEKALGLDGAPYRKFRAGGVNWQGT